MSEKNFMAYGDAETILTEYADRIKLSPPIFGDTRAAWDLLTDEQKAQYDYTAFKDDITDLDDATELSDEIAANTTLIKDTVGWTGKNLNSYPYDHTTKTESGVTFTDNGDGTITVNGTATADATFLCHFRTNVDPNNLVLPNGKYILSGCPEGGAYNKYVIGANRTHNGAHDSLGYDYGDGVEITLNGDDYSADSVDIGIYIQIKNGVTVSNLVFKPMLRKASIADATFEPYHESVEAMYEEEIHGVNLNSYPYNQTTKTLNGITFTDNGDGSVKVNGTATDYANFICHNRVKGQPNSIVIPNGKYIVTGCPANSGCRIDVLITKNGASKNIGNETGSGLTITLNGDDYSDSQVNLGIVISVPNGTTVSNLIFKPMLRKAEIEDSTYRPYNQQAIQRQLDAQGVLGAKNLNKYPYDESVITRDGITYTTNADGSITANGTATALSVFTCHSRLLEKTPVIPNGSYILSGCPFGGASNKYYIQAVRTYNNAFASIGYDYGEGKQITLNGDDYSANGVRLQIQVYIASGTTVNNLVFKPMLRLASDPDNTYQPYAMTNRELTEYEWQTVASAQGSSSTTNEALFGTFAPYIDNANYEYRMLMYVSGVPCNIYSESRYYSNTIHFYSIMGNISGYVEYNIAITINTSTLKGTHVEVKIASDGTVTVEDKTSEGTSSSNKYYLQRRKHVAV